MLKILIVDDSAFARKLIREMISSDPELSVSGEAEDGAQAIKMARELDPDAIVLDLILPDQDGVLVAENILEKCSIPIVLFSSLANADSEVTKEFFRRGVLDVIQKPDQPAALKISRVELISKVKAAAKTKSTFQSLFQNRRLLSPKRVPVANAAKSVIAIVASAGSPSILTFLLKELSRPDSDIKMSTSAILVALHMPKQFLDTYVGALASILPYPTGLARNGEIIKAKGIYFSPGNSTLTIKKTQLGAIVKLENLKVSLQPHFDTFLTSAALTFQKRTTAIILSGMGRHGYEGAVSVKKGGGRVIVQEPSTAGIPTMPQSVLDGGYADASLPPPSMRNAILRIEDHDNGNEPKSVFRSKGIIFLSVKKYIQSEFNNKGWQKILDFLSNDIRKEISDAILPSVYYSQLAYLEVHRALVKHFGQGALEHVGEWAVTLEAEQVYPSLFTSKYKTTEDFFLSFPSFTNLISDGVTGVVRDLNLEKRTAVLEIFGGDLKRESAEIMLARGKGSFRKLLTRLGTHHPVVSGTTYEHKDAAGVRYFIKWEQ